VPRQFCKNNFKNNLFTNDFLDVFPQEEKTIYNDIISQLMEQGANYASLSGAGSTCFGVFEDEQQSKRAVEALRGKWAFVQDCKTLYNTE
jgi:4-diphosphocytidyl-2C-methyl-D-erythritol kinase